MINAIKIKDAFSLIRNGANIKQGGDDSGYPITRIETISNRVVDRNKMGYAGVIDIEKYEDYILQDGDILMSHINSEKHLGKTALYRQQDGETIIHGMNLLCLRPDTNIILSDYAFYFMSSDAFLRQIPNITKKSVNQASFTVTALKDLVMIVPNLKVQSTIVNTLKKVDELIKVRNEQLSKLDELVKSRFIEMFGDPVKNNMGWQTKKLNDVCDGIGDGLHGTPEYDECGEYPFINGNNLMDGKIIITSATKMVSEKTYIKHLVDVSHNAILISINGTLGKLAFYNGEKVMLGKSACYCNLMPTVNKVFVYGVMQSDAFAEFLDISSTKSTIKNVGLKAMREFDLILPPINLQNEFATFVEQTDKLKLEVKESLEKLETLKKSLMQKYFI